MSTHGPIQSEVADVMKDIGKTISAAVKPFGFALLVFPFDKDDGRMNYISNAERKEMIIAMKELISRMEGHDHDIEGHA